MLYFNWFDMCGIAGFSGNFERSLLEQMNQSIAHRGPDDAGVYIDQEQKIGLAHRRLSIIDLSAHGHQPMWDKTQTVAIVFNGEIFNYQELRSHLIKEGWEFESHCDTEVLLNLYLKEGEEMLGSLNGMFAFALWDTRNQTLFLARDGVGVKPLYYAETPKGFLFASELKALLAETSLEQTLNPEAIHYYLSYLWCPAPHTILHSVQKLKPGHALIVKNGKIEKNRPFYDLPYNQPIEIFSEKNAIEQVQHHVKQAVERQMVADVPVGAFLSGGLDSSAVVAFARQCSPHNQFDCFTIGFKDSSFQQEGMTDDLPFAQRVADYLDVNLHTIYVGTEMLDQLETMVYHLDEPQADPAPLNALFISKLAHDQGLKVLLSGAGGDDIFTGYRRHYALMQEHYWKWLPASMRGAVQNIANQIPVSTTL
ncbi:MAG: asparagine synthase (glutamine-hydrolyzing), partial [SAR324 cluster bacterium]|nr:asparagine synthase (glutamine-hydrolyzing) [SAR324 cluster bacterium]